ncbi:hypothetical protein C1S83_24935 [Vibrio parahaemolyticus]|nr:hypothetical protein C1S87_24420 [Vibrio parahaemolyticus]PMT83946.1 hypothetical protein C1S83_24935 [Vibrio parahaemolyticus]PMT85485.1 hypothetical protein C1T03_24965 [Vibrio parahaemolyticus]
MKKAIYLICLAILSGCNESKYPEGINYVSEANKNVFINYDGNNIYSFNNLDIDEVVVGKRIENDAYVTELHFTIQFNSKPSRIPKTISLQANQSNLSLFKCSECESTYEKWSRK